jgi:hypothetical protein
MKAKISVSVNELDFCCAKQEINNNINKTENAFFILMSFNDFDIIYIKKPVF